MEKPYERNPYRKTMVRLVKNQPVLSGLPEIVINSDFPAEVMQLPELTYETEHEYVITIQHFILKDACIVDMFLNLPDGVDIASVVLENHRIPYSQQGRSFQTSIEISGLSGACRTLNIHSLIRDPGVVLRIEHNREDRVAGAYHGQKYPLKQIKAALHYEFATRKVLSMMGIPDYLNSKKLGYMLILGFETCNPVHTDYPPHWHIIFRWPYFTGSQAPHIYLDDEGCNTLNKMYIDGISGVCREYQKEEWCRFVDMFGGDVFAIAITADGGIAFSAPTGPMYKITPFNGNKAHILRDDVNVLSVSVADDTQSSTVVVQYEDPYGGIAKECFKYDPDTGILLY